MACIDVLAQSTCALSRKHITLSNVDRAYVLSGVSSRSSFRILRARAIVRRLPMHKCSAGVRYHVRRSTQVTVAVLLPDANNRFQ